MNPSSCPWSSVCALVLIHFPDICIDLRYVHTPQLQFIIFCVFFSLLPRGLRMCLNECRPRAALHLYMQSCLRVSLYRQYKHAVAYINELKWKCNVRLQRETPRKLGQTHAQNKHANIWFAQFSLVVCCSGILINTLRVHSVHWNTTNPHRHKSSTWLRLQCDNWIVHQIAPYYAEMGHTFTANVHAANPFFFGRM